MAELYLDIIIKINFQINLYDTLSALLNKIQNSFYLQRKCSLIHLIYVFFRTLLYIILLYSVYVYSLSQNIFHSIVLIIIREP